MSITETATSAATMVRRVRSCAPDDPLAALFSAAASAPDARRTAGSNPTITDTATAVAVAKPGRAS